MVEEHDPFDAPGALPGLNFQQYFLNPGGDATEGAGNGKVSLHFLSRLLQTGQRPVPNGDDGPILPVPPAVLEIRPGRERPASR